MSMHSHKIFSFLVLLVTLVATSAHAQQGFNSASGSSLPLGAGGNTAMWITPGGAVGIGSQSPQAPLDVNGGIRGSSGATGTSCSPEGMMGYDMSTHQPVYCNQSKVWAVMGSSWRFGGVYVTCGNPPAGYTMCSAGMSNYYTGGCSCPSWAPHVLQLNGNWLNPGHLWYTTFYCVSD